MTRDKVFLWITRVLLASKQSAHSPMPSEELVQVRRTGLDMPGWEVEEEIEEEIEHRGGDLFGLSPTKTNRDTAPTPAIAVQAVGLKEERYVIDFSQTVGSPSTSSIVAWRMEHATARIIPHGR